MRSFLSFGVFILSCVALGGTLIFYSDGVLYVENRELDGEMVVEIPQGMSVQSVWGADFWYVQDPLNFTDLEKSLRGKRIGLVDAPKNGEIVSVEPLVIRDKNRFFLYNPELNRWISFEIEEPRRKLIVKGRGTVHLVFSSPGGWAAQYRFFENGFLEGDVTLSVQGVPSGDVYLVSASVRKALEEGILQSETARVYRVGEVRELDKNPTVNLFRKNVEEHGRYYKYAFDVREKGFDREWSDRFIYFRAPADMPRGILHYVSRVGDVDFPSFRAEIFDAPAGSLVEIYECKSPEVVVSGKILRMRNYDSYEEYIWKVTVKNERTEKVLVKIEVLGYDLELISSDVKPSSEEANKMIFDIQVPGKSEKSFQFYTRCKRW